jgi:iron only hydrogenase large subunit-like protein
MDALAAKNHKVCVITLDPSARASLGNHFECSIQGTQRKLTTLFKRWGATHVFDASVGGDIALIEARDEFIRRFRAAKGPGLDKSTKVIWKRPKTSVAISSTRIGYPEEDTMMSAAMLVASVEAEIQDARDKGIPLPPIPKPSDDTPLAGLPVLASSCPGWICYAEKTSAEALPYVSSTKSPQAIMGSLIKEKLCSALGVLPHEIYHVTIMPCFDKKLEASRKDFLQEVYSPPSP